MDGQSYLGLLDMINGGGAGRAGTRFQGGGLLSDIANALARPYGYEESLGAVRPQQRPMRAAGALPDMPVMSPLPMPRPAQPTMSPLEMFGGQPPAPYVSQMFYGGRGVVGMPSPPGVAVTPEEKAILDYLRSVGAVRF